MLVAYALQGVFQVCSRLFLIKNPTGADVVFRVVAAGPKDNALVLLLSDNAADGEDVSWIWDAELELLVPWSGTVLCGGTRAEDMALRLKYFPVFRKVLSGKSTALFFQMDWRLALVMDLQLASQTPLIEP